MTIIAPLLSEILADNLRYSFFWGGGGGWVTKLGLQSWNGWPKVVRLDIRMEKVGERWQGGHYGTSIKADKAPLPVSH